MPMPTKQILDLLQEVDSSALMLRPLSDWRPVLISECQVYVFGENYIAKRFDQINFKFCEKNEAKDILIDNLYALLRYKYFPKLTDEADEQISQIVRTFTVNLKSTLKKVSFDNASDAEHVDMLPDYCLAFRNGVYDFLHDTWLFKYQVIELENIHNSIYLYGNKYIVLWYLDFDFDPLPINITSVPFDSFVKFMKTSTATDRNYCFELIYNIAHDSYNCFSEKRLEHLAEILGYTCLNTFSQMFVMLIGSGQNGKNSLFDGCFTNRVVPKPAANDLDSIENDRFITGALENKSHNIFLETSAKTYADSKMLKALTGSMYQTIESKGVSKYSGVINCKYIFAGNDQEKIKFSDSTRGFRRRINIFEIYYQWDPQHHFLKTGDYYDTTFSDDLSELKNDISNVVMYVYFAMYGLASATKNFTQSFKFTSNDWSLQYSDVDLDLKNKLESITYDNLKHFIHQSPKIYNDAQVMLYGTDKKRLYTSKSMSDFGIHNYDEMWKLLDDDEMFASFFAENDILVSVRYLQLMTGNLLNAISFTHLVKKIYEITNFVTCNNNTPYVKCTFVNHRLKIIK